MNHQQIKDVVNQFQTTHNGAVVYACITPEELEEVIRNAYEQGFENGQINEREAGVY